MPIGPDTVTVILERPAATPVTAPADTLATLPCELSHTALSVTICSEESDIVAVATSRFVCAVPLNTVAPLIAIAVAATTGVLGGGVVGLPGGAAGPDFDPHALARIPTSITNRTPRGASMTGMFMGSIISLQRVLIFG